MGTFAGIYKANGSRIPDDKKAEFAANMEKLFKYAGFVQTDLTYLYGKHFWTICFPRPDERGRINVNMSFFEDDVWEDAVFNSNECYIYSEKVGWKQFNTAVVAAYMLEALYSEGPAVPLVNGEPILSKRIAGWINNVLDTDFLPKNCDPWPLYEALHEHKNEPNDEKNPYGYVFVGENVGILEWSTEAVNWRDVENFIAICAVEKGVPTVISRLEEESRDRKGDGKVHGDVLAVKAYEEIRKFKSSHEQSEDEQIGIICSLFREYLHCDETAHAINMAWNDRGLILVNFYLAMTGCIQLAVAFVADVYGRDFWELWGQIKNDASGCRIKPVFEPHDSDPMREVPPVSTEELFCVDADRLIAYWSPGCDIHFSTGMKESMGRIRHRFAEIMESDAEIEGGLKWICGLMVRACKEYYRIYTFSDFFEETIEHLSDKKYLAAWKIYEEMLDDPDMREAGSVIFSDEKYGERYFDRRYDTEPIYRLTENWEWIPPERKFNRARVMLQGYMSLLFNRDLRAEVLEF